MSVVMRFGDNFPAPGSFGTVFPKTRTSCPGLAPLETRIRAAVRRCIADEVERLVDMLDGLDVDPDFEDSADAEPSLGWMNPMGEHQDANQLAVRQTDICDRRFFKVRITDLEIARTSNDDRELDEAEGRQMDAGDMRERAAD